MWRMSPKFLTTEPDVRSLTKKALLSGEINKWEETGRRGRGGGRGKERERWGGKIIISDTKTKEIKGMVGEGCVG